MINKAKLVDEFHDKFKIKTRVEPSLIPKEEWELRYNMIKEELDEYKKACEEGDLVEIADALGDMDYLINGGYSIHGLIDKEQDVFQEINESNHSKADENGEPIFREDGKILKSNLYFKPDIESIIYG